MSEYGGIHSGYWGRAMNPVRLQDWFNANMPAEALIYKDGMVDQVMFVRDAITGLLARSYFEYERLPKVVSTHMSKSVRLPVYYFDSAYTKLIMRNNFYDWKVSVESKTGPLDLDLEGLCGTEEAIQDCYCEGFRTEWVLPAYAKSQERFTVELRDRYHLYTFLFLLKRAALHQGVFARKEIGVKLKHLDLLLTKLDEFHEKKRAGKIPHEQRMHGYRIASAFNALRDEAMKAPGVPRYPRLDGAFQKFWEGSRFDLQDDRKSARALLTEVQNVFNDI